MLETPKACTEFIAPPRVTQVAKIQSKKVAATRMALHNLNMPRLSCIISEWSKPVLTRQGINEAFSTGSQPQ